jgi:hypothetical protein
MSEDQQLQHLPQLAELLKNPWFKHFVARCETEKKLAAEAICLFPLNDFATAMTALQCRGEYKAYDMCIREMQESYDNLIEIVKEKENERDRRTTDS